MNSDQIAFLRAVTENDSAAVDAMLKENLHFLAQNMTVLWSVTAKGRLDLLQLFLDSRSVDLDAHGLYIFKGALLSKKRHVLDFVLIDLKMDVHQEDDLALSLTSAHGNFELVKYLVEEWDANINSKDKFPLKFSAQNGHKEVVTYLLEHGAIYDPQWRQETRREELITEEMHDFIDYVLSCTLIKPCLK